jgi:phospholipid transport system substrate-binding protein
VKKIIAWCLITWFMTISLAAHAEAVEPDVLVKNIAEDVLAVIRQNQANQAGGQEEILKLVNAKVLPHFDFERMTRLAVGRNWRKATPKQKNTLVAEFRNLLVNTYTNAFTRYRDNRQNTHPRTGRATDRCRL